MKSFVLTGAAMLTVVILISAVAFSSKTKEVPEKHIEVVLRDLGHRLLLTAKDSSSRVLPVRKLNENTYQIAFQNNFSFSSDSLINLVEREFEKAAFPEDYSVSLKNCEQKETVFAFEMSGQADNLTPCRGRKLDVGCYNIEVEFLKKEGFNFRWLLLLIIPLCVVGFFIRQGFHKKADKQPSDDGADYMQLGSYRFDAVNNVLISGGNRIPLTEKETKALQIFTENINQIVEREKLMKEIWEDHGIVVISRNVDVLVSKLRKKLSDDDSIKVTNVPGRGYKFTVG